MWAAVFSETAVPLCCCSCTRSACRDASPRRGLPSPQPCQPLIPPFAADIATLPHCIESTARLGVLRTGKLNQCSLNLNIHIYFFPNWLVSWLWCGAQVHPGWTWAQRQELWDPAQLPRCSLTAKPWPESKLKASSYSALKQQNIKYFNFSRHFQTLNVLSSVLRSQSNLQMKSSLFKAIL